MERHGISVIIPVYNAAPYLEEAVNSVLNQEYSDLEIILIDDCSEDNSAAICRKLVSTDSRIKFLQLPVNSGPGVTRNVGIDIAKGEYITFVDADDIVLPDAYSSMYEMAKKHALDIVRCEMSRLSSKGKVSAPYRSFGKPMIFNKRSELDLIALSVFSTLPTPDGFDWNFGGSACTAIHHYSLFIEGGLRFEDKKHMISEDFIFCFKATMLAKSFGVIPKAFYLYRVNEKSRSNVPRADIIERAVSTAEIMEKLISQYGFPPAQKRYAYAYIINVIRAFVKNYLLSSLPLSRIRAWFMQQQAHPILKRAYDSGVINELPLKHRMHFEAFYNKRFGVLFSMVRLQAAARRVMGKDVR